MEKQEAMEKALELASRCTIAMLGTNGDDGYPQIKAMIKMENEGLRAVWFSTNTSSRRVAQLQKDSRASVYFVDFEIWMGLMLVGEVEILQDAASRQRLWRDGYEKYYPLGVNDPDYTVLRFTAKWGDLYHRLCKVTFDV